MSDIEVLLRILHELVKHGHSVVMVEHHLDVIKAADWVIDLGPEAGAGGGLVVYEGPPVSLPKAKRSETGRCLRELDTERDKALTAKTERKSKRGKERPDVMTVQGRENNLKDVDVESRAISWWLSRDQAARARAR